MQTKILKCAVTYFLTAILGFFSMSIFADTYTWSLKNDEGVLIGGTFATETNWTLSDGTVATEAPGADDDVIIPSGSAEYTVTVSSAFKVKSLTIGDNDDASAVVTLTFKNGKTTNEVVNAVMVGAKAKLTHPQQPKSKDNKGKDKTSNDVTSANVSTKTTYRLNLRAGGDITIYGKVNADGCGFPSGWGPCPNGGSGFTFRGAAHGGIGFRGSKSDSNSLSAYGSIRNPNDPGSGGGNYGGGVIYIASGGTLTIGGSVSAKGTSTANGSGGSIILKGNAIAGSGRVTVKGGEGTSQTYKGGGGGRIAIYTNESKEFSEIGIIPTAEGGVLSGGSSNGSSCGTIYFESGNHEPGRGELIIDGKGQSHRNNNSVSSIYKNVTILNTNIRDINEPFGKLIIKDGPQVRVGTGVTLTLTSAISITTANGSTSRIFTDPTTAAGVFAGISIAPPSGTVFTYQGAVATNHNFTCIAPGATVSFVPGASMYIAKNGKLTLAGEQDSFLTLAPSTESGVWTLNVGAGANISVDYVNVSKGNASGLPISANNSVGDDYSKDHKWVFPEPILPGDLLTWTGGTDTSWVNLDNWLDKVDKGRAPIDTDFITIPAGCLNYPKLIAETKVNKLLVEEGALINLSGANIIVTNTLTVAGDITRSTTEKLIVAGEGDATLDFGNREYGDIHITKSGGTITLPNGLKTKRLKITSSAATTFVMPAGKTIEADVLDIDGNNGDFANKLITIVSSTPGTKWNLKVNDVMRIRGVNVSDSDASLGRTIAVGDFASNEGNNVNWDFTSGSAAEWVGGTDSNWTTPGNWLPEGVPGEATVVAIRPKAAVTVTLSSTETIVPVGGIMLGGSDFSATLKCNKAVEVAGGVDIDAKGILILNSIATNNIVNGNFVARSGSKITHDGPRWNNTQSCGVNLLVKGDMRVEKFGTTKAEINVEGKGFANGYGPGYAYGSGDSTPNPSHGGIGNIQNATSCYGSILNPYSFGSPYPASGASGGGQVAITVKGDLIVDGAISANGGTSDGGTGGSILIKAASLRGAGTVSADGKSTAYGAAGGRVAIYLTEATSIASLTGGVTVYGNYSNSRYAGAGTKYYQFANNDEGGGTVYFNPGGNCGTSFPMADDGNPRTAYAKATVELSSGTLYILKDTTVYDLNIKGGKINLQGHTLRVLSNKHKDGRGWTNSYANSVIANGGEIIWGAGFTIKIR